MRRAFTLVELMIVLVIIAAVTHLSVREFTKFGESRLVIAADRQLEEIRAASLRFAADMGRLISATNDTLSELWIMPEDAVEYRTFSTNGIHLAGGWRGPYLRLPPGKTTLRDPWGNEFRHSINDGYERLTLSNDFAIAVAHYGMDNQTNDLRRVSLLPRGKLVRNVFVTIHHTSDATVSTATAYQSYAGGVRAREVDGFAFNEEFRVVGVTVPGELVLAWSENARTKLVRATLEENQDRIWLEVP